MIDSKLKSIQMRNGKAFEYALLTQLDEKLREKTSIEIIKNSSYEIAKMCFETLSNSHSSEYLLTASFAINFLIDIEPRLSNDLGPNDLLQLEILTDHQGELGDVRDVIAVRLLQKWEIGISAKNNHHAVKHSRLSSSIDFGMKWLGLGVSSEYFNQVKPIFNNLNKIRNESLRTKRWSDLGDYQSSVYVPILEAFINELIKLNEQNPKLVASRLVSYLVGNKDFYKIIKSKNNVEIHAYNINGTLNLSFGEIRPKYITPIVPLPSEILDIQFKNNSKTTIIVTMNNDWELSFRIHNASSKVESSLKFDINLIKSPNSMFKNTLIIKENSL